MGLFKPAWQSKNREKALKAVEKENDQAKLAVIAKSAPLVDVQTAAVAKLSDESVLFDVAKSYIRGSLVPMFRAIDKISDLSLLKEIEHHYDFLFIKQHSSYIEALRDAAKKRRIRLEREIVPSIDDIVNAYMENPKNQRISTLLTRLSSGSYEMRKQAAAELIEIANREPKTILNIWDWIKEKVEEPYQEYRVNCYDLEEAGIYSDRGIGMKFPKKPKLI